MTTSKIEWTDRSDWNPLRGCTRVSAGCQHCYAETIAARFSGPAQPFHGYAERTSKGGRWTGKVELIEDRLTLPLRWRKPAPGRNKVFASSTSDIFHESLSDANIDRIFAVMALRPDHTFQVLTKRAARMREYLSQFGQGGTPHRIDGQMQAIAASHPKAMKAFMDFAAVWPLPNVWLGVSVEDQATADQRIPDLLATPAAIRFLSCEPLLGPVNAKTGLLLNDKNAPLFFNPPRHHVDWIIAGGESGPGARPMHPDWVRGLRNQCLAAGVPFFFKQWGSHAWIESIEGDQASLTLVRTAKKSSGRALDGREWSEFPR